MAVDAMATAAADPIESPAAQVKFIEDAASSTGLSSALGTIGVVIHFVASVVIVAGAVIGYIPQYRSIVKLQNADGFSTLVSLILIVSNTTRVFFWFGRDFEVTLLYQSVAVVSAQLAMIQLCTRVRVASLHAAKRRRRFTDFVLSDFWNWDDFASYLQAEAALVGVLLLLSLAFMRYEWFVDMLGTIALGVEATLGVPQIYRNFVKQSTAGLSLAMIVSWFAGDAFKTVYFLSSGAPAQFLYCGFFQLCCDCVILYQMFVAYATESQRFDITQWCKARFLRAWVRRLVNRDKRSRSEDDGTNHFHV